MENLRCFNCQHTNLSHDNAFNVSEVRKTFLNPNVSEREIEDVDSEQNGVGEIDKENLFHVMCGDCIYDRLQVCQDCYEKAPLCMFKVGEWFKERNSRVCINCSAAKDSMQLLKDGCEMRQLIHQCFHCGHFRYLQSFMISSKFDLDKIPRECLSCLLKSDIKQYKDDLHEKYENKLRQEPVLGQKNESPAVSSSKDKTQPAAVLSYASVVTKGSSGNDSAQNITQNSHILNGDIGNDMAERNKMLKLTTFSAVINESICKKVLEALKFSFKQLEEKTKLELQLMQLDPQLCHGILRDKLIRVSHRFSKQGTQQTLFDDPESRWAYMGTYTVAHASLVLATLQSGIFPPLDALMKTLTKEKKSQVCCFGAGPGSEVLGLSQCFPADTQWILLDNCQGWEHLANVMLKRVSGMPFHYSLCDVSQKLPTKVNPLEFPYSAFASAKLMMFVKFISAVQNLAGARKYLSSILKMASPGTMFLFIDNAHIQTKYFIEDLVFSSSKYVDNGDFKENDFYTLYTTYAELKSEDDAQKSALMCDWVGYISYWLDRWPMLDLRVNVLLAVKKNKGTSKR